MASDTPNIFDILSRFINTTNEHIFLTGKAGTGKTTFLRKIAQSTHKNMVIAAPTGIAAINAGGVTLHSLFQLPFGTFIPDNEGLDNISLGSVPINTPKTLLQKLQMHKNKRNLLQQMELLVIDEVSMLRADLLDAIDQTLRSIRKQKHLAFGGVQMLFIGDLLQLPPVVKDDEWTFLSKYYANPYFFNAQVLKKIPLVYIELEKIYRQSDNRFINLLNNLRDNNISSEDINLLNEFYQPDYKQRSDDGVILLTTHNKIADERNANTLAEINKPERIFTALITGEFSEYNYPAEEDLVLKPGAQVMFIKNDYSGEQRYFNGKIGYVESFNDDNITINFKDGSESTTVEPYTWENKRYVLNSQSNEIEEHIIGTFMQYPLKLAWAITVHKSQGLTFDKAIIDVNKAFAPGQIYVALSRLRHIDGLILTSKIPTQGIPISNALHEFSRYKKNTEELLPILQMTSNAYLQNYCLEAFSFNSLMLELRFHVESYNKTENRSEKQKHQKWASELYNQSDKLKEVGDSFRNQIYKIIQSNTSNNLELLNERIEKSIAYFEPLIKGLHQQVVDKIDEINTVKGIKTFLSELDELTKLYQTQLQQIYKAKSLIQATLEGNSLNKSSLEKPKFNKIQSVKIRHKAKEVAAPKATKIPSHEVSYQLFKEGKSISEIAKERTILRATIEEHLATCVAEGLLDIYQLITKERLAEIEKVITQVGGDKLTPFKEQLGDAYSYSEIKLVAKYLKSSPFLNKKQP